MCETIAHGGFGLHPPPDQWCVASLHVPVGHRYVFFGKMSIPILELSLRGWVRAHCPGEIRKGILGRRDRQPAQVQRQSMVECVSELPVLWKGCATELSWQRGRRRGMRGRRKSDYEDWDCLRPLWQLWPEWVGSREEVGRCFQEVSHEIKDSPSRCAPPS